MPGLRAAEKGNCALKDSQATNLDSATISASGQKLRGLDLLTFVERESKLKGKSEGTVEGDVSVARAFLVSNGCGLENEVDIKLLDRLADALAAGSLSAAHFELPSVGADDAAYRGRIAALVRAQQALNLRSFQPVLRDFLKSAHLQFGLTYETVANELGVPRYKLNNWVHQSTGAISNMTPLEAIRLDDLCAASGALFAAFVVFTQHGAFSIQPSATDKVLEHESFAMLLSRCRRTKAVTLKWVLAQVQAKTNVFLGNCVLSSWERGATTPSQPMRVVVEALDELYEQQGRLVSAWESTNPKPVYSRYALRQPKWPEKLDREFKGWVEYRMRNPEGLPFSQRLGAGQWSGNATEERVRELIERFSGYLIGPGGFERDSLTLTLTADWGLVVGWLDFVRARVGRADYSADAITTVKVLLGLYDWYLPHLFEQAGQEDYWAKRLPTHAIGKKMFGTGIEQSYNIELSGLSQRWGYQLFLARTKAVEFLRTAKPDGGSLGASAESLFDMDDAIAMVAQDIADRIRDLPLQIRARAAAIQLRQLAEVALILARCLRPETLIALLCEHVIVNEFDPIRLKIPEDLFKTKGRGGSRGGLDGEVSELEFISHVLRRWKLEGRPILVEEAARLGITDAGHFFTPDYQSFSKTAGPNEVGGRLHHESLRRDVQMVLGYAPYAHRHLFATEAWLRGVRSEVTARVLMNTARMVENFYARQTASTRLRRANGVFERLAFGFPN